MNYETEKALQQSEDSGLLDPTCPTCKKVYEALRAGRQWPPGPAHRPSSLCQSGQKPHCSCGACF